jgi:hypothetical protein
MGSGSLVLERQTLERLNDMKKKTLTNKTGEVRELTHADIKKMRSAREVLPENLLKFFQVEKLVNKDPKNHP